MPLLHLSLRLIDFYSPSLRWFLQAVTGSDRPSYRPILLHLLQLIGFYSPSLRGFASTGGLRSPLLQTHTASFASSYWLLQPFSPLVFTSAGELKLLSFMPILHRSLQLVDFYSPSATILIFLFFSFCFSPIQFLMSESVIFPIGK